MENQKYENKYNMERGNMTQATEILSPKAGEGKCEKRRRAGSAEIQPVRGGPPENR